MTLHLLILEGHFKKIVFDDINALNAFNLFFIVCAKNSMLSTLLI
ncbi:hypothetical protein ALO46_102073 [Pseudomonas syringae pv. solidagae]|uniref:Uncharacterized protein n=3 Tax=Pseudomonas syringae group TaxID=136849 RepID=A0A3M5WG45_9PSED|nr:hypothetical protein PSYAR_16510 [Pseudomonas syringae pv. aceris str. M302273]KOG06118.1 Uncharacterized protein ABJ98_3580 [Pseudomonas syringae pv. aceris]KPY54045.1 hypothetical protein ALO46_102073 [Pseudomonas syringae pv. solidagae]RMU68675.1 hypothetical protein ALP23_101778 [Pseudomonas syringae pv. apii]KPW05878.1 hypothetical protein ALO91_102381 [Pseudomonas syringae pv. aceris]